MYFLKPRTLSLTSELIQACHTGIPLPLLFALFPRSLLPVQTSAWPLGGIPHDLGCVGPASTSGFVLTLPSAPCSKHPETFLVHNTLSTFQPQGPCICCHLCLKPSAQLCARVGPAYLSSLSSKATAQPQRGAPSIACHSTWRFFVEHVTRCSYPRISSHACLFPNPPPPATRT